MEKNITETSIADIDLKHEVDAAEIQDALKPISELPTSLRRKFERSWRNSTGLFNSEKTKPTKHISTDDSLVQYMHSIGQNPLLTKEGEILLSQLIERGISSEQDSEEYWEGVWAKEKLVVSNLRLVVSIAKRYVRADSPSNLLDLIQDGTIGLGRAAEKYDWRKGFKFSTYATWWIRQAIGRSNMNDDTGMYIPSQKKDLLKRLNKAEITVESSGEIATPENIAIAANLDQKEVVALLSLRRLAAVFSIDKTISRFGEASEGEATLSEIIGEKDINFEIIEDKFCAEAISSVLEKINSRDKDILARRFGIHPYEPHSLEEVGQVYGLTRERVRQIEKRVLKDLKINSEIVDIWEAYY